MKSWNIAYLAAVVSCPVVFAQASDPASAGGAAFLQQAMQEQTTELELSKIAQKSSTSSVVINFARATVRDETEANRALRELAARKGIQLPEAADAEHAATVKALGGKSGTELDAYYTKDMANADAKLIELFQSASSDSDHEVSAYAQRALPDEEQHEKVAQSLADSTARRAS